MTRVSRSAAIGALLAGGLLLSLPALAQNQDLLAGVIPGADATSSGMSVKSQILVIMTLLGLLPVMIMMMTCFTRFVIILSLLRQALGLQQGLPTRIITGIALILTILVMRPIGEQVWKEAFLPYDQDQIGLEQALRIAEVPLSRFMLPRPARPRWRRWRAWRASRNMRSRSSTASRSSWPPSCCPN